MHAQYPIGPLFEGIVYVRDMAAQVEFYRDVLGLPLRWPPDAADYAEVRSPAPGVQVADCRDPEGHGFFIESQTA